MSLRIHFDFLDEQGNFLYNSPVISTWNLDRTDDLNFIYKELKKFIQHPMIVHGSTIRYAVPKTVNSYMFDLQTFQLLPNKFLDKEKFNKHSGYSRVGHNNV